MLLKIRFKYYMSTNINNKILSKLNYPYGM